MELQIHQLEKGMIVKVVFYHSQKPQNFYTRELGIIHDVDIQKNLVTVEVLTHGFRKDNYVSQTDFFTNSDQSLLVKNENNGFYKIESCDPKELKEAEESLKKYHEQEQKKVRQLKKSLQFLAGLIKKAQN